MNSRGQESSTPHTAMAPTPHTLPTGAAACAPPDGRGVSTQYEGRDETCPVCTGKGGGGARPGATRGSPFAARCRAVSRARAAPLQGKQQFGGRSEGRAGGNGSKGGQTGGNGSKDGGNQHLFGGAEVVELVEVHNLRAPGRSGRAHPQRARASAAPGGEPNGGGGGGVDAARGVSGSPDPLCRATASQARTKTRGRRGEGGERGEATPRP